ncbi:MAG: hypothetical protein KDA31_08595 [Phycisphaerales bacterium]|nr:hypothetical protein [Phycisphaerales bacterium]
MSEEPVPDQAVHSRLFSVESIKKVGSILTLAYAIGLLIENVFYSFFGLEEFELLRARYVFVGLAYLIWLLYVLSPVAMFIVIIKSGITRSIASEWRLQQKGFVIAANVVIIIVIIYAGISLLALPLHYFVTIRQTGSFFTFGHYFYSSMCFPSSLWFVTCSLLNIPLGLLVGDYLANGRVRRTKYLPALLTAIVFGIISTIVPYAMHVFPNVSYSMGGGQPRAIYISMEHAAQIEASAILSPSDGWDFESTEGLVGPIVCWKREGGRLYLSQADSPMFANIVVVQEDQVGAYVLSRAKLYMSFNKMISVGIGSDWEFDVKIAKLREEFDKAMQDLEAMVESAKADAEIRSKGSYDPASMHVPVDSD